MWWKSFTTGSFWAFILQSKKISQWWRLLMIRLAREKGRLRIGPLGMTWQLSQIGYGVFTLLKHWTIVYFVISTDCLGVGQAIFYMLSFYVNIPLFVFAFFTLVVLLLTHLNLSIIFNFFLYHLANTLRKKLF